MKCEKCSERMHVTSTRKCKSGSGSSNIPRRLKSLFDEITYRNWKCEKCQISIKTVEAKVEDILSMEKKAKLEILKSALKLV